MYTGIGILCSHSLGVLNINYVHAIPSQYIKKRWKKHVMLSSNSCITDTISEAHCKEIQVSSIWTQQMIRKFSNLIIDGELDQKHRCYIEEGFKQTRNKTIDEVGINFYVNDSECEGESLILKI